MQWLSNVFTKVQRHGPELWKVVYLAAAGAVLFMGLERRFAFPLTPVLDLDSPNFLWPALLKLNGAGFVHTAGLNFLYPGSLYLLLRGFDDYRAIVIFQHLLGVVGGIFLLLGWNRLYAFDAGSALSKAGHDVIGLFGAAMYLLSPIPIVFELHIRPEPVCLSLQLISFWLIVQVLFYQATSNQRKTVVYAVAAGASALLLCALKPSYTLTALFVIAFVSWLVLRGAPGWKWRAIFFAAVVGTSLLLFIPERVLSRNDRASRLFLPQTLFSVHANIIRAQMGDDLAREAPIPFPRPWLQGAYDELGAEMSRPPVSTPSGFFSRLGFEPDLLMNGEHAIFNRWLQQLGSDAEFERFLTYYYWRALSHRPLDFAAKAVRQMGAFYTWKCPAFLTYPRTPLVAVHYGQSKTLIKDARNWEQIGKSPAGSEFLAQTENLLGREMVFDSGKSFYFCHSLLGRAYLPALLAGVVLALWVLVFRKSSGREWWAAVLIVFLFLLNFGNVLALAFVHSVEVTRYSTVQFGVALVAELWAIRCLLSFILRHCRQRRPAGRPRSCSSAAVTLPPGRTRFGPGAGLRRE